jgi:dihydrofolate reductase
MHTIAYIACSLDGFIAGQNGDLDWLNFVPASKIEYYDFDKLQDDIDCLLMGRNTFEKVQEFDEWPYRKKVFVLSSKLKSLDIKYENKAEIITGNIKDVLDSLERKGNRNVYVDGGKVIQECINEKLLDEIIITTISKILGEGIRLFENINRLIELELEYSLRLNDQMVMNKYIIRK